MNVYDFDKTIFKGDSTYRFFMFCLRRRPGVFIRLPRIAFYAVRYYVFHKGTKTQFKEKMYSFLKACDAPADVESFWKKNIDNIYPYYRERHRDTDVIISASPEFLLKPLESKLRVTVIASRVSPSDGKTTGENCYHAEKVRRFLEIYPDAEIDEFYSDSYSDEPLALLAKRAYIVRDGELTDWDYSVHKKRLRT